MRFGAPAASLFELDARELPPRRTLQGEPSLHTFFRGKDGVMAKRWDTETKEKAVRLVIDHWSDYFSEWAAITTVASPRG